MSCTFLILLVVLALLAVVNGISIPKNRLITSSTRYHKDELAIGMHFLFLIKS